MRIILIPILLAVLLTGLSIPRAVDADDDWGRHPGWIGSWQATPEIERLLGIEPRKGEPKFPTKLHVSFFNNKEAAVAVMGKESIELIEARYSKMKHTIIAAGQWDAGQDFKGFKDFRRVVKKDSFCFVTTSRGATFLWFGTPEVTLKEAEVHFIHGVDSKHDLLVLDFGLSNFRARLYAGDTVGYKRADD